MRIVAISDTHNQHYRFTESIPECDILIHAGDFTGRGTELECITFMQWFNSLAQAKHKVFIAGNHDKWMQKSGFRQKNLELLGLNKIQYLMDSSIEIQGVQIYGTPWTPFFYDWAFQGLEMKEFLGYDYEGGPGRYAVSEPNYPLLSEVYGKIPKADIVICHGPPSKTTICNADDSRPCGSDELYLALIQTQPKYCISGHIHEGYGKDTIGNTICYNVSSLGRDYRTPNPITTFEF
jgi:Icc-related predicted phosphoesterase